MHCPSCGQQQVSNETKFCSRCGLPLVLVAELLVHGGFLPQLALLNQQKKKFFTKKNGVVLGSFWFLFLTLFCTSFFGVLGAPEEFVGVLAVTGLFGSIMIILASLIFLPSSKPTFPAINNLQQPNAIPGMNAQTQQALPPQQTMPADFYSAPKTGNWRDTSDLEPGSVTESTTRLLTREDKK